MRNLVTLLGLVFAAGCTNSLPPVKDPVVHDVTLRYTSFQDDYNSYGIKETRPINTTATGALLIDFSTQGARFEMDGQVPCVVPNGRMSVGDRLFSGKFEIANGGAVFTMSGSMDSVGVMAGTFTCQTRTGSPHYFLYSGNLSATRR